MNGLKHLRFPVALFVAAACTLTLAGAGGDAIKKDLRRFQGTWQYTSVVSDGKKVPEDKVTMVTITFKGDKYTVRDGDKVVARGTQKLDPSKTPSTVDAIPDGGKGPTTLGIYEFDGDTLKFCFDQKGKKRPTAFESPKGSNYFLATAKRVKK
jgi:uncharacterized protein (TIGR03067 family)